MNIWIGLTTTQMRSKGPTKKGTWHCDSWNKLEYNNIKNKWIFLLIFSTLTALTSSISCRSPWSNSFSRRTPYCSGFCVMEPNCWRVSSRTFLMWFSLHLSTWSRAAFSIFELWLQRSTNAQTQSDKSVRIFSNTERSLWQCFTTEAGRLTNLKKSLDFELQLIA